MLKRDKSVRVTCETECGKCSICQDQLRDDMHDELLEKLKKKMYDGVPQYDHRQTMRFLETRQK